MTARFQEAYFKALTGQDLVITYKPGAGGATAWSQLNGYPADGYTMMNVNFPHAILQPAMKNVGFQTADVMPSYVFHYTPDAILVRADSPYKTLKDLIDDAKANPGAVTFAGSGTNTASHLGAVRFESMTGTNVTYIPFKGSAPSLTALLGGQVKAAMSYPTQAIGAGDGVRMLAVATKERVASFPDVPTFKEAGYEYLGGTYRAVSVPKATPEPVKQKLSELIGKVNADPAFKKKMLDNGYVLVDVGEKDMAAWVDQQRKELAPGIELLKKSK